MDTTERTVRGFISSTDFLKKLERIAPKHLNLTRLVTIALSEIKKTPTLALCNPYEVGGCIFQAAQIGLEVGGILGNAYLIVTGKKEPKCSVWVGYKGLINVACRSSVAMMDAKLIYENDHFNFNYGGPKLSHSYDLRIDRGEVIGAYSQAFLKNKSKKIEVMSLNEINENHRAMSSSYKYAEENNLFNSVWHKNYNGMALKTPIRKIFNQIDCSVEMNMALDINLSAELETQDNQQKFIELADVNESNLIPAEEFLTTAQSETYNILNKEAA